MNKAFRIRGAAFLAPVLAACAARSSSTTPGPTELGRAESLYADLRDMRDRIDIVLAMRGDAVRSGAAVSTMISTHNRLRRKLATRLAAIDSVALDPLHRRAFGVMRQTLDLELDTLAGPASAQLDSAHAGSPDCNYDPSSLVALPKGLDSLRNRLYRCYGWAQSHVAVGKDTLDRLTILAALGHTVEPLRRRQLFLSLEPVWRSMNADNGPGSPYRRLVADEMKIRNDGRLPSLKQAEASGVPPDSLERWLTAMLTTWREANPDSLVEPWDWYYQMGQASRALSHRVSRAGLMRINAEVYRSLGADLEALRVQYDIDPREGKTPVAYTTFLSRPRFINGAWRPGAPWVFATYRTGGLNNLSELLHETGHAVHIAAIRTRPAFADWPDSDPFTEALADFVALEVYEPRWQQRWIGDSVSLTEGLRERYSGIVMDVTWALFEIRMQHDPGADPNQVWTALTRDFLRIRPHPELSWWAMRGQLVHAPGYMMNYAAGAILIAAIRARTRALHGPFTTGDSTWYGWIAPRLFRFGLERPSREVIEEFLGGPVSPEAILADMKRMRR